MSRASVATPIAAGIAGLILEFARQPSLGYQPEIAAKLQDMGHMKELLKEQFSDACSLVPFQFLKPWKSFFSRKGDFGGNAPETSAVRYKAAERIIQCLERRRQDVRSLTIQELIDYRQFHRLIQACSRGVDISKLVDKTEGIEHIVAIDGLCELGFIEEQEDTEDSEES
jgi:hypothetical protein